MATPTRGKKRLVVDVDLELDSETEVAAAFSRLSVSILAKPTADGSGKEHSTSKPFTCEATSGTFNTQQSHQQHPESSNIPNPRSVSVRFPFHQF
jgi:hypothetical protein